MPGQPSTADIRTARLLAAEALRSLDRGQDDVARALADIALVHARLAAGPADDAEPRWVPAREPTAEDKILLSLAEAPEPGFLHIDRIVEVTGAPRKTVENALTCLVKSGRVIRNPTAPGQYSVPSAEPTGVPAPAATP
ncbi:hypothetical protein PUR61_05335 [Streptomyces sp. BE20]|uniref:hypothetical protein n=1 Tax=Streptomyces sp. BE20 TaxID=3002525 RepID=UPI002E783165|nr:hypothetical protein [Streptomyces sp. BE20]MEE1821621.1 hypothetical protein [Streptomyces sp. BE20]